MQRTFEHIPTDWMYSCSLGNPSPVYRTHRPDPAAALDIDIVGSALPVSADDSVSVVLCTQCNHRPPSLHILLTALTICKLAGDHFGSS